MNAPVDQNEIQTAAAVAFLKKWPVAYPTLVAIDVDGAIETRSFPPPAGKTDVEWAAVANWIYPRQGRKNIYYSVNPTRYAMSKKPANADIKDVCVLHIDIDPAENETQEAAKARGIAALAAYPIKPSVVTFSGGGVQAFWILTEPITLPGDKESADEFARYNWQLALDLKGDATARDVSRIMRLPHTKNIPNAGKVAKGRKPMWAEVISSTDSTVSIDKFTKAPPPTNAVTPEGQRPRLERASIDDGKVSVGWLKSIDDLRPDVKNHARLSIMHGDNLQHLHDCHKEIGHRLDAGPYESHSDVGIAVAGVLDRAAYTPEQIYGILLDPKFGVSKHFLRQKDRKRAVLRAINHSRELEFGNAAVAKIAAATGVTFPDGVDRRGIPTPTYGNTQAALLGLGIDASYDDFHHQPLVEGHVIDQWSGAVTDHVITVMQDIVYKKFGFYPSETFTRNAVITRCRQHTFNPVLDYIDSLKWDRVERLDKLLLTYLCAEDTKFNRAVGRKALIAMIARARRPGVKFDSVLVLDGKQGIGKSLFCKDLAGGDEFFSDADLLAQDSKTQMEQVQGVWVAELPELAGIRKAETEKLKAFFTRTTDSARPAYGRFRTDVPRSCIFIGTTNADDYLSDPSGNRRYWPVGVKQYQREAFLRDRNQLLAEAAHYEACGEALYLPADLLDDAAKVQHSRLEQEPWLDLIGPISGKHFEDHEGNWERISSAYLIDTVLKLPSDRATSGAARRLATAMRRLGWSGPKKMRFAKDGKPVQGYYRPALTEGAS